MLYFLTSEDPSHILRYPQGQVPFYKSHNQSAHGGDPRGKTLLDQGIFADISAPTIDSGR